MRKPGWLLAALSLTLAFGRAAADDLPVVTPAPPSVQAQEETPVRAEHNQSVMVELLDIPTADILEPMTYSTAFRFYNEGGLSSRLVIGPLKRVNLGISFDAQRVIGSGDPHMIRPSLFFKLRMFD